MKLLVKLSLLGAPLVVMLGVIVLADPFRVFWKYEFGDYYNDQPFELNRDYVSTEMLLARYRTNPPNAFIFGSSRSFSYYCDEWQKHIKGARCFHYPAANENLSGIHSKIKLIDRLSLPLNHALIVLDYGALGTEHRRDHLHILHPAETGESWARYQLEYVKACFSNRFILKYIDYRLFGRTDDIFAIKRGDARVDPTTNDYYFEAEERKLAVDESGFYRERARLFSVSRSPRDAQAGISSEQRKLLLEIKETFDRHGTDYRIVISPMYDQIRFNPQDLAALRDIFGAGYVFDYSGTNSITSDTRNFYDPGHYRPHVANMILEEIYR